MAIVESVASSGPRRRLRVKSPVTLESIGEFECASAEEVRAAVERARKTQADWARLSFDDRAAYMWRLLDQFVAGDVVLLATPWDVTREVLEAGGDFGAAHHGADRRTEHERGQRGGRREAEREQ